MLDQHPVLACKPGDLPHKWLRFMVADITHTVITKATAGAGPLPAGANLCHYYALVGTEVANHLLGADRYQPNGGYLMMKTASGWQCGPQHAWIVATHENRKGQRIEVVDLSSRHYLWWARQLGIPVEATEAPEFVWGWRDQLSNPAWGYTNDAASIKELCETANSPAFQHASSTLVEAAVGGIEKFLAAGGIS